jgi:hypothetical protein
MQSFSQTCSVVGAQRACWLGVSRSAGAAGPSTSAKLKADDTAKDMLLPSLCLADLA